GRAACRPPALSPPGCRAPLRSSVPPAPRTPPGGPARSWATPGSRAARARRPWPACPGAAGPGARSSTPLEHDLAEGHRRLLGLERVRGPVVLLDAVVVVVLGVSLRVSGHDVQYVVLDTVEL